MTPTTPITLDTQEFLEPDPAPGETTVVFHNHKFSVGLRMEVAVMAQPHRHSQFEINHLLSGAMTYWLDGREVRLEAGRTAIFWGMVPHQAIAHEPDTRFVCLYLPAAIVVSLPIGETLRKALFSGDVVEATRQLSTDDASFLRWREDLMADDPGLEGIVRDELSARLRRVDRDGWRDLRDASVVALGDSRRGAGGADKVETMARFIGENSARDISASEVAAAAALHPNYAMGLFRKGTGLTITQYINRCRLDTAQALLVANDDDIAGIAFASGFGSLSRFYEAFQSRFTMSPARFRRWHRGLDEAG